MRASIIIAAHNEGERLGRTIASCVESIVDLDYEVVVVDDASTDGSVDAAVARFPQIQAVRNHRRGGAAAAKARGAAQARGETLVFLDGHTKPEGRAVERLVAIVERLGGQAIVTPRVAALDTARWEVDQSQTGNGYWLDLATLDCGWRELAELAPVRDDGLLLYESPALIGCALAVDRRLYAKLGGFDAGMLSWGVEDLDFGLKCWLMGHRILHDPQATIGHRFRDTFDDYPVPPEHVLHNQVRMVYKNFGYGTYAAWMDACRLRNNDALAERAEGLWAAAWQLFVSGRASADQERAYLQARRTRDELWYAKRFGLSWPGLADAGQATVLPVAAARPSPSPRPSVPPPQCQITGVDPGVVTILVGVRQRFTARGAKVTGARWLTVPPGNPATGAGASFTTMFTSPGPKLVRASCGSSSGTATVIVVAVTGRLTPRDNFTGRSTTRFGVGELIDLSFTASPSVSAAALGGLRWFIASGGGTLTGTGGNDGKGLYRAAATGATVRLVLKVASGPNAGKIVAQKSITIVPPSNGLIVRKPGTGLRHTVGTWSVGFKGEFHLMPKDVSFINMHMREGTVNATASGYLAPLAVPPIGTHPIGPDLSCTGGNITTGTKVSAIDTIFSGQLPPPFSVGDFVWAIPWEYRVGSSAFRRFTTANHHATAAINGRAEITKKGAGPFSRLPSDPTSTY
jgi:GT2 family glycosyltransferase